jgi:hypothetical protein
MDEKRKLTLAAHVVQNFFGKCRTGTVRAVQRLLNCHPDVLMVRDPTGRNVFHHIMSGDNFPVLEFVLEQLHRLSNDELVFQMVNQVALGGCTPCHEAYQCKSLRCVELLRQHGAKLTGDRRGVTLLHLFVSEDNLACLKGLLEWDDVDLDAATMDGEAPLHWAATQGKLTAFVALIVKGADTKRRNKAGNNVEDIIAKSNTAQTTGFATFLEGLPCRRIRVKTTLLQFMAGYFHPGLAPLVADYVGLDAPEPCRHRFRR